MAGVRKALIVATDDYSDPKLARLNAPATDARALAEVLDDQHVGAFEVETVLNAQCQDVRVALARFLKSGKRGDTLLLHFSCHGVKDLSGELYFATTDTDLSLLEVTGVASSVVNEHMEESRASLILCFVDCCYSGAFTKSTKAADTIDLTERLGGQGRAVITASTSLQLALDGEDDASLFTRVLVEGLRTGEADRDLDGLVSLDELYSFVHERVTEVNPGQTPLKRFDVQGDVYVARRKSPLTTPAALPRPLLDALTTGEVWERRGAVTKLAELMVAGHPGRALAAKLELERLSAEDDSAQVQQDAADALAADGNQAATLPAIPVYVEEAEDNAEDNAEDDGEGDEQDLVEHDDEDDGERRGDQEATPWTRWLAAGAVALALVGGVVWVYVTFVADGEDDPIRKQTDTIALRESQMLVPTDVDGARRILAVDIESGDSYPVLRDADVYLPTITHDREWMIYLKGTRGLREPYLVQVDGRLDGPLLASEFRDDCPFARRPTQSIDGGSIALVCLDEAGEPQGLYSADTQGLLTPLYEDPRVVGSPTWTGNGSVVFTMLDPDGGPSSLWELPSGGGTPQQLQLVTQGWAASPDWAEQGLLYLDSPAEGEPGDVHVRTPDGRDTRLTFSGEAEWPTWSPDGDRFAFLVEDDAGQSSVWVQDADPRAEPEPVDVDGAPGAPAWGSR